MEPQRITPAEARALMDSGHPVTFVDTRAADAWKSSNIRIKGAVRVPPDEAERNLEKVPKDRSIIAYCT
ncbi:MAG: rhodanese-like domain-containing protein [Gemmatimonadaceae bacterium]